MAESLLSYQEVQNRIDINNKTSHLLLGNGFSIACDLLFQYNRLYDHVLAAGLSRRIVEVFEHIGTNNFEGVMHLLAEADWICHHYQLSEVNVTPMLDDLSIVRNALVKAVAETHPEHSNSIEESKKAQCAEFLRPYHNVFTTNYDLLLYWVEMQALSTLQGRDGFSSPPGNSDADYVLFSEHVGGHKGIFFIHGALHLYVYNGEVRKHSWLRSQKTLIQNIMENLKNNKYPLFVAEGQAEKKLAQIQGNGYLSYCLGKLGRIEKNLVTVGLSFADNDRHISDVLADNRKLETLYIGLFGDPQTAVNQNLKRNVERIIQRRKNHIVAHSRGWKPLEVCYYDVATANIWGVAT